MSLDCGIVGLPNIGKSSLFNALNEKALADAANFPFCTIEPNVSEIAVPDARLDALAALAQSAKRVPTFLRFVDIAGLVKGASKGEGLGNQFLDNIRSCDALIHLVRCFEGDEVQHVDGRVDANADMETITTELLLADLMVMERRANAAEKRAQGGDKDAKREAAAAAPVVAALKKGEPARSVSVAKEDEPFFKQWQLLSTLPIIYVANVGENVGEDAASTNAASLAAVKARAQAEGAPCLKLCVQTEAELAAFSADERAEYHAHAQTESGLAQLIRAAYATLGLCTFFTAGPKEARAWTLPRATRAQDAAGRIHTDFARGFIRAETISYDDYIAHKGEAGAKAAGRMRQEGRDYIVQDGDVILFRFNV